MRSALCNGIAGAIRWAGHFTRHRAEALSRIQRGVLSAVNVQVPVPGDHDKRLLLSGRAVGHFVVAWAEMARFPRLCNRVRAHQL